LHGPDKAEVIKERGLSFPNTVERLNGSGLLFVLTCFIYVSWLGGISSPSLALYASFFCSHIDLCVLNSRIGSFVGSLRFSSEANTNTNVRTLIHDWNH
jgi:hypothetical protein